MTFPCLMKDYVPVKIKQSIEKPPYSLPFSATGILHGYAAGRSPTAAAGQPVYPFLTVNDRGQPPPPDSFPAERRRSMK